MGYESTPRYRHERQTDSNATRCHARIYDVRSLRTPEMTVTKDEILREVKRTALANGGRPLGRLAFFRETGIRENDWRGRFWARWNEVLKDAGFGPNALVEARPEEVLLGHFADLALELGRLPVYSELRLKKRTDPTFPNDKTFMRLGAAMSRGMLNG